MMNKKITLDSKKVTPGCLMIHDISATDYIDVEIYVHLQGDSYLLFICERDESSIHLIKTSEHWRHFRKWTERDYVIIKPARSA